MLNKASLIGRLGKDPEVRYTQDSKPVANFSVATTDKYNGEEQTEWHRVVCFGKLAEIVEKYLHKGSLIYIDGKITTRKWTDNDGVERYNTEIIGNTMKMLGSKGEAQEANPQAVSATQTEDAPFNDTSDVPF